MKVIITGVTGMVGEGVLLECLAHPAVEKVLAVSRKPGGHEHAKLEQLLVPDFTDLEAVESELAGYDACFYCAGVSSNGMSEADYTRITYDTTLHFARTLVKVNPAMVFVHVSGAHTDGTEQGSVMWARVKGRAENALAKLPFAKVYNFRPGFMRPTEGQRSAKWYFGALGKMHPVLRALFPGSVSTMHQVGLAMILIVMTGHPKQVLEVRDINALAGE